MKLRRLAAVSELANLRDKRDRRPPDPEELSVVLFTRHDMLTLMLTERESNFSILETLQLTQLARLTLTITPC